MPGYVGIIIAIIRIMKQPVWWKERHFFFSWLMWRFRLMTKMHFFGIRYGKMITINMISQSYHIFILFHRWCSFSFGGAVEGNSDLPPTQAPPKKRNKPKKSNKTTFGRYTPEVSHSPDKKMLLWETGTLLGELNLTSGYCKPWRFQPHHSKGIPPPNALWPVY